MVYANSHNHSREISENEDLLFRGTISKRLKRQSSEKYTGKILLIFEEKDLNLKYKHCTTAIIII